MKKQLNTGGSPWKSREFMNELLKSAIYPSIPIVDTLRTPLAPGAGMLPPQFSGRATLVGGRGSRAGSPLKLDVEHRPAR